MEKTSGHNFYRDGSKFGFNSFQSGSLYWIELLYLMILLVENQKKKKKKNSEPF